MRWFNNSGGSIVLCGRQYAAVIHERATHIKWYWCNKPMGHPPPCGRRGDYPETEEHISRGEN